MKPMRVLVAFAVVAPKVVVVKGKAKEESVIGDEPMTAKVAQEVPPEQATEVVATPVTPAPPFE